MPVDSSSVGLAEALAVRINLATDFNKQKRHTMNDIEPRYKIIYATEDGMLVAYHYFDGKLIQRQVIMRVEPMPPVIDPIVLNAGFKAMLATAAVIALINGYPEAALGIIYILKMITE